MKNTILEDLKNAMKQQNKELMNVIRSIKGAIQLEEIRLKHELSDDEIIGVIAKQIKTRKESLIEFEKGKRQDLIDLTNREIDMIMKYLPKQLSSEEISKIIDEVFDLVKPSSQKDMGKIMKEVTAKVKGKADMKEVSNIIKSKLENIL